MVNCQNSLLITTGFLATCNFFMTIEPGPNSHSDSSDNLVTLKTTMQLLKPPCNIGDLALNLLNLMKPQKFFNYTLRNLKNLFFKANTHATLRRPSVAKGRN